MQFEHATDLFGRHFGQAQLWDFVFLKKFRCHRLNAGFGRSADDVAEEVHFIDMKWEFGHMALFVAVIYGQEFHWPGLKTGSLAPVVLSLIRKKERRFQAIPVAGIPTKAIPFR